MRTALLFGGIGLVGHGVYYAIQLYEMGGQGNHSIALVFTSIIQSLPFFALYEVLDRLDVLSGTKYSGVEKPKTDVQEADELITEKVLKVIGQDSDTTSSI